MPLEPYDALGMIVSMKSGLEGRNKWCSGCRPGRPNVVSMKSGLEGRNKRGTRVFP